MWGGVRANGWSHQAMAEAVRASLITATMWLSQKQNCCQQSCDLIHRLEGGA